MIWSFIFIQLIVLLARGLPTAKAAPTGATSSKDSNPLSPFGPFEAFDNQFPYMVSIRRTEFELMLDEGIHICAGALIRVEVVLTAAHCIFDMFGNYVGSRSALTIVAGSKYINGGNSSRIQRRASKVYVYPAFSRYTREADLAVIVLDNAFTLQDNVNFIDVAKSPSIAGEKCFVLGWNDYSITNISSNVLQYYVVQLFPEEVCQGSYNNFTKYLPANQLCACPAVFDAYHNVCNNSNVCMDPTPPIISNDTQLTPSTLNEPRLGMVPPSLPSPTTSIILNHLQWNNRFPPGRNRDSGDPGSILVCNSQIAGLLAYSHRCEDIAGRPQIFTDITEYGDFVNDPANYLPGMFKFIIHEDSESSEGGGMGDEGRAQCEVDFILILTLILINLRVICSHY